MSTVAVLNTDAGLSGKTIDLLESAQTITGVKTFDLDPAAPFAVTSGSAKVTNLDADKLDGQEGAYYQDASNLNAGTIPVARVVAADPNADRIVFWDDSAGSLAFLTAGTGLSISGTTLSLAGNFTGYTATLANCTNTTGETDVISITMPAAEMADGDIVVMDFSYLINCAAASNFEVKAYFGASSATLITGIAFTTGGVERKRMNKVIMQRVGADLWFNDTGASAWPTYWGFDLESAAGVVKVAATPTFSSSQTVKLTFTFSGANANNYFKPQVARVYRIS